MTMTTRAMTRSMCMNPPMVYELTRPRTQRIKRMMMMVSSISYLHFFQEAYIIGRKPSEYLILQTTLINKEYKKTVPC
jgi:hypothetical protein